MPPPKKDKIVCIIQMSIKKNSSGQKNLLFSKIEKVAMIEILIRRLKRISYIKTICISIPEGDDSRILKGIIKKYDLQLFAGPGKNLRERYLRIFNEAMSDFVIRITPEFPFIDIEVIRNMIEFCQKQKDWDLIIPVGFPIGVAPMFLHSRSQNKFTKNDPDDLHPFYYIQDRPEKFKILEYFADERYFYPHLDLRVLTKEQLELMQQFAGDRKEVHLEDLIDEAKKKKTEQIKGIRKLYEKKRLNMKTKNILFLDHSHKIGGSEVSLLRILEKLKEDFNVFVGVGGTGQFGDILENKGFNVVYLPINYSLNQEIEVDDLLKIINYVIDENIGILYCNTALAIKIGNYISKIINVKVVSHVRDLALTCSEIWKMGLNNSELIIANSKAVRNRLIKYKIDPKKINVIYNWIDSNVNFKNEKAGIAFRKTEKTNKNEFLVGFLGQIEKWKGIFDLIHAISLLKEHLPNIKCYIAGHSLTKNDKTINELKNEILRLKMENDIILLGFVNNINSFLNAIDILVVPSHYEPFGRVVIEAMAAETPVIGTDGGGIPELIKHNYTGLLVPIRNPNAISKSIEILSENYLLTKRITNNAKKMIQNDFNADYLSNKIINLLENIF